MIEPFQLEPDDVRYLISLLDSLPAEALRPEAAEAEIAEAARRLVRVEPELRGAALTVGDLDLEALSSELMGLLDPIGQLQAWLADQLKGIASWFSTVVDGVVRNLWNLFVKPALDAINYVVLGIRDRLAVLGDVAARISQGVSDAISRIGELAKAVGGIAGQIVGQIAGALSGLRDFLASSLAGIVSAVNQAAAAISAGLKAALDALARLPDTIRSIAGGAVEAAVKTISGAVAGIGDVVKGAISGLISTISDFFGKIGSAVAGLADQVAKGFGALSAMVGSALETLKGLWAAVEGAVRSAAEGIGRAVASLSEQVLGALKGFAGTVTDFFGKIGASLAGVADSLAKGFAGLLEALKASVADLWGRVQGAVGALAETISKAIAPIAETVSRGFADLGRWMAQAGQALQQVGVVITGFVNAVAQLPDRISGFFKWISDAIEGLKQALLNFFKDPVGALRSALEGIGKWIWDALPGWLKDAIEAAKGFFEGLRKGLDEFVKDPLGFIQKGFSWLAEQIWNLLPDWLKGAIEAVKGFFEWLRERLQEFAKDPLGFIYNAFKWIGEEIWKRLPEPLKWITENVQKALQSAWDAVVKFFTKDLPGFFAWLWEGIQAFAKDPVGWLQKNVGEPLWNFAKWVWEKIVEGAKWIWEQLQALGAAVWRALADVGSAIWGAVGGALQQLAMAAKGVAEAVVSAVFGLIAKAVVGAADLVEKALAEVIREYAKHIEALEGSSGKGEAWFMLALPAAAIPALSTVYALPPAVSSVSYTVDSFELHGEGSGRPFGIGVALAMRLRTAVLKALKEFGDMAKDAVSDLMTGFWMGFFVAMWDAIKYLSRASWKKTFREAGLGDLPIEMPALGEVIEMARRLDLREQVRRLRKILMFYGFPDWYVDYLTKLEEELSIQVTDRFGTPRKVPLSPLYDWPSVSEIAAWAVRDVFGAGRAGFEQYFKWAERMGVPRDLAILQYISRFKYPPPGALWTFVARALAGLAWYTPSADDVATAQAEAAFIGARAPLPPTALNFQAKRLFDALSVYMTWHDLANYAWLPDWTSDNWLVIDTLADIPGRIDVRWMTRFGLMDFMASKGIGLTTPASEFVKVVEAAARNPALTMDLTLVSRLIQATGLHPYYVPIVAVAETINAFSDERTLLRTGIVDLYEKGVADLATLDDLMSNLSVLSFKVAYFDMQTMSWREGFVNVPLAFLPGERKLIEMRAVIDRYLAIYGKATTEIVGGVRSLVLTPAEARRRLEQFGSEVARALSRAMKAVIGRDVAFKVDAEYLDAWLSYAQLLAEVETAERLRTFTSRVGGWLLYRVASGHVTDEELSRVVEVLRRQFYMTDAEAKALLELARVMRDIAKREPVAGEVLPSLGTLAAMAEYVEVPLDYVQRILAERRVEKTYAELWLKYLLARTIASEVNALASTYRRIVEHFGLPAELEKQVKELMRAGGWTERELQIFDLDLSLRRAYRILSTFIPTLRQFAGDAMYLGEWEKLFEDLLRARGLDVEKYKAQVEYYRKLIKSRKLWRRVSMFITELVNCYAYGVIDERTLRRELEPLRTYGLDDMEIELIVKTAKYRAVRLAAR